MKEETICAMTAIIALCILESIALFQGINGAKFALVAMAISALGGYEIKGMLVKREKINEKTT